MQTLQRLSCSITTAVKSNGCSLNSKGCSDATNIASCNMMSNNWSLNPTKESFGSKVTNGGLNVCCRGATKTLKTEPASGNGSIRKGFGAKTAPKIKPETKQDGPARLKVSEKLYDKLYGKDNTRPYVISVRKKINGSDWLPVAILVLETTKESHEGVTSAIPFCCRELAACARMFAIPFENCLSKDLEYAFEPEKSFMERPIVVAFTDRMDEGKDGKSLLSGGEGEDCPYSVLGIQKDANVSQIRSAYRSMAAAHHPDKFQEADRESAEVRFKEVANAYERIKRQTGGAELLGGTGSVAEDGFTVLSFKGEATGKAPANLKIGLCPIDFRYTDLFVKDPLYLRPGREQRYWSPDDWL